jgi:hypothetical protein
MSQNIIKLLGRTRRKFPIRVMEATPVAKLTMHKRIDTRRRRKEIRPSALEARAARNLGG